MTAAELAAGFIPHREDHDPHRMANVCMHCDDLLDILFEDDDDLEDPSLRDDTLSADRYAVLPCGFSHKETGWVGCVAPLGHESVKHSLPTPKVAA